MVENEDDNDDECSLEDKSRVAGYLRQFIESGRVFILIQSVYTVYVCMIYNRDASQSWNSRTACEI